MKSIEFPTFTGLRCLMMPYIQGDPSSLPDDFNHAGVHGREGYFTQNPKVRHED